jgi:FtsZ-interacting cell division protein ZipA
VTDLKVEYVILSLLLGYVIFMIYEQRTFLFFQLKRFFYTKTDLHSLKKKEFDVIQLIIKPKDGEFFDGPTFDQVLKELHLIFGKDQFFHKKEHERVIYSVCHLYPPGTFAHYQMDRSSYSGCKFFLVLDDDYDKHGVSFDLMLKDAQYLAMMLHAELLDEAENALTSVSINFIKQKIILDSYHYRPTH